MIHCVVRIIWYSAGGLENNLVRQEKNEKRNGQTLLCTKGLRDIQENRSSWNSSDTAWIKPKNRYNLNYANRRGKQDTPIRKINLRKVEKEMLLMSREGKIQYKIILCLILLC